MRQHLSSVFGRREDPYAGVDLASASRFGGALWFIGALLVALILPFAPPTDAVGDTGWVITAAMIVLGVAVGWRMRSQGSRLHPNELIVYSYLAVASLGLFVWLNNGVGSPYSQLFILSALYTCAAHPARRLLPYLAWFTLVVLLPFVYDDHVTRRAATTHVVELVVWLALAFAVVFLMHNVRTQRLGLRAEGEQARRQARADQLTGLLNRRAFDEDLARAIETARTTGQPLSVIVGDLDDFKDFNDRYGHLEGDKVLQAVAAALRAALRKPDVAYRWGGDEFAVILPQADIRGADLVADRLEAAVARCSGPDGDPLGITTGVAELDPDERDAAAAMVATADHALMRTKGSGAFEVPQTRR